MPTDLRLKYDERVRRRASELFNLGYGVGAASRALALPRSAVRKRRRTYLSLGLDALMSMGSERAKCTWEQKCAAAEDPRAEARGAGLQARGRERLPIKLVALRAEETFRTGSSPRR